MSLSQAGFVSSHPQLRLGQFQASGPNSNVSSPARSHFPYRPFAAKQGRAQLMPPHRQQVPSMTCLPAPSPPHHDDILPSSSKNYPNSRSRNSSPHLDSTVVSMELLQKRIKTNPNDSRAWLQLGKLLRKSSGPNYAVRHMRRAVEALPFEPHLWHYYADLVRQASGVKKALPVFRDAVRQCPENTVILAACASAEASLSNYQVAEKLFRRAVAASPTDHVIYLQWGQAERDRRQYNRARAIYTKASEVVPDRARCRIYTVYAGMEASLGNYDRARELYRLAAECSPSDKLVWQPWACMEQRAGDIDRARQLFERAVLCDPSHVGSWQAWGLLEQSAGFYDVARQLFERGTLADSVSPLCWQSWAILEADLGNTIEARRLFEEGAQRVLDNKSASPLFIQWARFEEASGNIALSRQCYQNALSRSDEKLHDRIRVIHAWAGLEQRVGQIEEARTLYNKALKMNDRDFRTLYAVGVLELDAGDTNLAHHFLYRCVRAAPRDASAVRALATLEVEHFADDGGLEKARRVLQRAVSLRKHKDSLLEFWATLEEKHGDVNEAGRLRCMIDAGQMSHRSQQEAVSVQ